MTDPIRELKTRAEIFHGRIQAQDQLALGRLRMLPAYRRSADTDLAKIAPTIQRRDCLNVIAAEMGFSNWPQAKSALAGIGPTEDFGTLLCPRKCGGHVNRWYARYEEAATVRETCQGYLLAYRRQFLVVDRYYIESLGLDPEDADWQALGFDWVRPKNVAARTRLYAKLVTALPREAA